MLRLTSMTTSKFRGDRNSSISIVININSNNVIYRGKASNIYQQTLISSEYPQEVYEENKQGGYQLA